MNLISITGSSVGKILAYVSELWEDRFPEPERLLFSRQQFQRLAEVGAVCRRPLEGGSVVGPRRSRT